MVSAMAPIMPPPAQLITSPQCQSPTVTASKSPRALAATGFSTRASIVSPVAHLDNKGESMSPPQGDGIPKMEPFNRSRISRLMKEPPLLQKAEQGLADRCTTLEGDDAYNCWEALFEFENLKNEFQQECEVAADADKGSACRPLERFENLVRQSGGVSTLIDNVRMLAYANKKQHDAGKAAVQGATKKRTTSGGDEEELQASIPDAAGDGGVDEARNAGDDGGVHEAHNVESQAEAKEVGEANNGSGSLGLFQSDDVPDGVPRSEQELLLEQSALLPDSPLTRMLRRRGHRDKAW